ncbi:methyltransferase [Streptomyces sp. NPDC057638]|uniref:bifunctional class I SAM-dependent methyltransferase/NUDIX hydrolase n=1 Tax=Streptomyces sp. NPDC057638 TaxID=3346190 RepID=UPI0036D004BC
MGYETPDEWEQHFARGEGFRRLGERERALLAEHAPAPSGGGRALDVGSGTGELAAHLAAAGYRVDAVDYTGSAHDRARTEHPGDGRVRRILLDIEHGDPASLDPEGYDLITLRLVYAFLGDRTRVLHGLGKRLRPGGALVVITPLAADTRPEQRDIALDEGEIALLGAGWETVVREDADGLAVLVLRGPRHGHTRAVERLGPVSGPAVAGALAVVTDRAGRVLLGHSRRKMWELPGGKSDGSEDFTAAGVRELAEETGLAAQDARLAALLHDSIKGVPRLTAVVRVTAWSGVPAVLEPDLFDRWEWHRPEDLSCVGRVFTPAAHVLAEVWPGRLSGLPPVTVYPLAGPVAVKHAVEAAVR